MSTPHPDPPPIGSAAWDAELLAFHVERAQADLLVALALACASAPTATLTAHDIDLSPSALLSTFEAELELPAEVRRPGPWTDAAALAAREGIAALVRAHEATDSGPDAYLILRAAAWFLFHQDHPGYASMMYLRLETWLPIQRGGAALVDWFVRQLAALKRHGTPAQVASVDYALGVDYFEDPADAQLVFPRLVELLPEMHAELLGRSSYLVWAAKRAFYTALAARPDMHAQLAQAIHSSIDSAFFGTIDVREALDLSAGLRIDDQALRERLHRDLTTPLRAVLRGLIHIEGPGRPGQTYPSPHLLALAPLQRQGPLPSWFSDCELWMGEVCLGQVVRARFGVDYADPFLEQPPYGHQPPRYHRWEAPRGAGEGGAEWHAVAAGVELRPLLGRHLELWPRQVRRYVTSALHGESGSAC